MTTVTHGEIIDLNVRIENPGDKGIVFRMFLQFFYFWDTHAHLIIILGFLITILKRFERLQTNIRTAKN